MTAAIVATAEEARALTDRIKVAVEGTWELIKQAYSTGAWAALGYGSWDDYCTREFGTSRLRLPREDRPVEIPSMRDSGMSIRAIATATGLSVGSVHASIAGVQNRTPAAPDPHIEKPVFGPAQEADGRAAAPIGGVPGSAAPTSPIPVEITEESVAEAIEEAEAYGVQWDDEPALTEEECEALANPADLDDDPEPVPTITGRDGKTYPATQPRKPSRKPITESFQTATFDLGKKVTTLTNLAADDRFNRNADQIRDRNLSDLIRARDAVQRVIDLLTN